MQLKCGLAENAESKSQNESTAGSISEATVCGVVSLQNTSRFQLPLLAKQENFTLLSPSRSDTSSNVLDMSYTEGQERDSTDGQVSQRTRHPTRTSLTRDSLERPKFYCQSYQFVIVFGEPEMLCRFQCDTGFPDGTQENPSFGHDQGHLELASSNGAVNEAFSIHSQSTTQERPFWCMNRTINTLLWQWHPNGNRHREGICWEYKEKTTVISKFTFNRLRQQRWLR